MNRKREIIALLFGDFIAINASWILFRWIRFYSGWFSKASEPFDISDIFRSMIIIYFMWMVAFIFFGLYRTWWVRPIFDEVITVLKTIAFGTLGFVVFFLWEPISNIDKPYVNDPRLLGVIYFAITSAGVIGFRLIIRFTQRRLLEAGIGRRPSIVIGNLERAKDLSQKVAHYPRLGYDVVGFVAPENALTSPESFLISNRNGSITQKEIKKLGTVSELEKIAEEHKAKEVLIALDSGDHGSLIQIIGRLARTNVGIKIAPDLYDIVSGQARTREIYGFPLIDINPELQRPWEQAAKRMLDISVSFAVILLGMPFWLITALLVKLTSKGPIIYSQERIGKQGEIFYIYKFRSMRVDAEQAGVPQWASKNDPRVTPIGKFLRKSHLDEVPQFWNVLKGDMSLVGPRPERQFFVEKLIEEIPYYTRRLKVRPGITGLYQAMVDKYDENIDDVKERVRYDLMYIESMSFRLDIKILFRTAYMMLKGKGQA